MRPLKIAFVAGPTPKSQNARTRLAARYGDVPPDDADVVVALGGDGLMLQTLHGFMNSGKPIYGMNCGSVGFLMNEYGEDDLLERLAVAERTLIRPLLMKALDVSGREHVGRAVNEVSLLRQTHQTAKLRISVDGKVQLEELLCDGVLVSTPVGSTAYNLSAHGPILPIDSPLLAVTPISAFRPRRWRGALLHKDAKIRIDVLEPEKRPVSACADHDEVRNVVSVGVEEDAASSMLMMFDPGHNLDERILAEQFRF
jgi:NAD+ kinase